MAEILAESILVGETPSSNGRFEIPEERLGRTVAKYKRFSRSLAKDGFISLYCLDEAVRKFAERFPENRAGLYTAFGNGPLPEAFLGESTSASLYTYLRWNFPPKQHFKQSAPIRASHFGMVLGIHGPQMCFVNPIAGYLDALNAAEVDLHLKKVDYAIVTGAFSFEDTRLVQLYGQSAENLRETGVCLVLARGKRLQQWTLKDRSHPPEAGVCTPYCARNFILS